ncbi:unnamed protein product [Ectocarpus sp. 12 AP-2014]
MTGRSSGARRPFVSPKQHQRWPRRSGTTWRSRGYWGCSTGWTARPSRRSAARSGLRRGRQNSPRSGRPSSRSSRRGTGLGPRSRPTWPPSRASSPSQRRASQGEEDDKGGRGRTHNRAYRSH